MLRLKQIFAKRAPIDAAILGKICRGLMPMPHSSILKHSSLLECFHEGQLSRESA